MRAGRALVPAGAAAVVAALLPLAVVAPSGPAAPRQPLPSGLIAFVRLTDAERGDIWLVDARSGSEARLTTGGADDGSPAWSPDGREIAFTRSDDVGSSVYVARPDGVMRQLTGGGAQTATPAWSPDGRRIAYAAADERSGGWSIWTMWSDGGGDIRVTNPGFGSDGSPAWSPDGRRIAFARSGRGNSALYVVAAGGGEPTRLTDPGPPAWGASWSPDGRLIAFVRGGDVHVIRPDGTGERSLTGDAALDIYPTWSPDGRMLAFTSDRGGRAALWAVPLAGGSPVRIGRTRGHDGTPDDLDASWQPLPPHGGPFGADPERAAAG